MSGPVDAEPKSGSLSRATTAKLLLDDQARFEADGSWTYGIETENVCVGGPEPAPPVSHSPGCAVRNVAVDPTRSIGELPRRTIGEARQHALGLAAPVLKWAGVSPDSATVTTLGELQVVEVQPGIDGPLGVSTRIVVDADRVVFAEGRHPDAPSSEPKPPALDPAGTFQSVAVSADGRTINVRFYGGVKECNTYALRTKETDAGVYLWLSHTTPRTAGACIQIAQLLAASVTLRDPLGARPLVDAATGAEVQPSPDPRVSGGKTHTWRAPWIANLPGPQEDAETAVVSEDGLRLTVTFYGFGPACHEYQIGAEEHADVVDLTLTIMPTPTAPFARCVAGLQRTSVNLDKPLAERNLTRSVIWPK